MRYALLALILCSGCSGLIQPSGTAPVPVPAPVPPPADMLRDVKAALRASARQLEEEGDSRGALEKRRMLAAISHDDSSLSDSVRGAEETLRREAEEIFRRGLAQHRRGDFPAARSSYLAALRTDPDHDAALEEVKNGLADDFIIYRPRKEETPAVIAGKVYGNGDLAAVLAVVNGLDPARAVPAGALVTVPRLEGSLLAALADPAGRKGAPGKKSPAAAADQPGTYSQEEASGPEGLLASARRFFNERRFREAVKEAGKIPDDDPLAPEAREIINGAYFHIGGQLADEGRLPMALDAYRHVDKNYRNAGETVSKLEKRMIDLAEEHYIAGVKFFVSQRLEEAITEWEKTLALNPSHEKAGEDIRKAGKLLEELRKVQEPDAPAPK